MLARDLMGVRVYRAPAKDKAVDKDGAPLEPKRLGRVHFPVFIPDGTRVVGFMVKLPDVAGMIKQKDRFVALDALTVYEGTFAVTDVRENFDAPAAKRLGIDLDRCLIWTGMDVLTESGEKIGWCVDASFNGKTGAVDHFVLTASSYRARAAPARRWWAISRCPWRICAATATARWLFRTRRKGCSSRAEPPPKPRR